MAQGAVKRRERFAEAEIGTIRKDGRGRIRIALIYPNMYHVGMSNLGFQAVYRLLNDIEDVVCERSFLPDGGFTANTRITTIESNRPVKDFDIIAFSVSFESDYSNLLSILHAAGIPLYSEMRAPPFPLVIAGGVACCINPEPIAPFVDCFLIGEAEAVLYGFLDCFDKKAFASAKERKQRLKILANNFPGAYVPSFYKPFYDTDGNILSFEPVCDVPEKIGRVFLKDISDTTTSTAILTPYTSFKQTYLIETGRGCPHGCRFCSAGFIYRPPRFRSTSMIKKSMEKGFLITNSIGLVGAAVSDLPEIGKLCCEVMKKGFRISFSSLRADALTPELVSVLRKSGVKTATIAPDAGSERMRSVINKGITEDDIFNAVENLVAGGILNLKLYFMIGLPTETIDDVYALVQLCREIRARFLRSSRLKKRIGKITVSVNPFIPKPFTPFQWAAMADKQGLKEKINIIKKGLKNVPNLRVHAGSPRRAHIQALLSRGDRKISQVLALAVTNRLNWTKTLKESQVKSEDYIFRERSLDELFPWDFIDHRVYKSFLKKEYKLANQGKMSSPCDVSSCRICGACG